MGARGAIQQSDPPMRLGGVEGVALSVARDDAAVGFGPVLRDRGDSLGPVGTARVRRDSGLAADDGEPPPGVGELRAVGPRQR